MTPERTTRELLPESVAQVLEEHRRAHGLDFHLWLSRAEDPPFHLFPANGDGTGDPRPDSVLLSVPIRSGDELVLELRSPRDDRERSIANVLRSTLERLYENAEEIRFFTYEMSDRYEEINLLYSISETLGSLLGLDDAARLILQEVCDVVGARRGSLWVFDAPDRSLRLVASVGEHGLEGPLEVEDGNAVTAQVFREGRPLILTGERFGSNGAGGESQPTDPGDSVLSVPIRYTPPSGNPRTVGVINLIGRRRGGRFAASDQKLLSAIASQVGAALENNRLLQESLEQERVSREMELAHNLQMKLLPDVCALVPEGVAARVEPAESVGGDFFHLFRLSGGRFGVMIGDVSSHGFPAALIMALAMSAASIHASEVESPEEVLAEMSASLRDELESTEMYLTLFYGVLDPEAGELVYANAGHPHAFLLPGEGEPRRLKALDLPMGIQPGDDFGKARVPWESGRDLLLLFTDGLSDDLRVSGGRRGEQMVVDRARELRDQSPAEIVDALFRLQREREEDLDDRSALALRL
ncbi:MAG: GAF domain-containing protein [Gemmatimonadales bacterium]|nr:MAG: GAF domain-containing protein [Gemmatimonadales bacterium]